MRFTWKSKLLLVLHPTTDVSSLAANPIRDAFSLHVSEADEAINLGRLVNGGPNPFLNVQLLVETAVRTGADAVHPGYGYLSENADFADAVRRAGLVFIGPSAQAMSTLGDKRASKDYLRQHEPSIPLIPGFAGSSQNVTDLEAAAGELGFPVMLKASAGGGGRGMRIVKERSTLREELARAQSEAARAFGSGDCILEKYIEAGKHIEIQIVGDSHGNVVSFWERECSIQRRHQKVIEETPCLWLTQDKRRAMSATARKIGEILKYEGAGTVEFVVDVVSGKFYFLEFNTRLQVEHPITEEVTGFDLVALQLFVAAGGSLASLTNLRSIPQNGHAIECRLCAEDPQRDFFPEHGTIRLWRPAMTAAPLRDLRYETGVQTGSQISIYFDSMIAKIVVWAPTRSMAIQRMVKALSDTACIGLRTNQLFTQSCLLSPMFQDLAYTTSFIPTNRDKLIRNPYQPHLKKLLRSFCVIPGIFLQNMESVIASHSTTRPFQNVRRGFRSQHRDPINLHSHVVSIVDPPRLTESMVCIREAATAEATQYDRAHLSPLPALQPTASNTTAQGEKGRSAAAEATARYIEISKAIRSGSVAKTGVLHEVRVEKYEARIVSVGATSSSLPSKKIPWVVACMDLTIDNTRVQVQLATETTENAISRSTRVGQPQRIFCHFAALGTCVEFRVYSMLSFCESVRQEIVGQDGGSGVQSKVVHAPMPCKVLSIAKTEGEAVKAGETVMVVESMKMEMTISAFMAGKFHTTLRKGDAVDEGAVLCSVE